MLLLFCKSMIPVRFCTILPLHSSAGIKTRFKALFYAKLVSAITQRISKLWCRTTHQSKALDEIYNLAVSKRDLKHFSKSDLPGFAGTYFSWIFAPGGRLSYEAYKVNSFLSKSKVPKMEFFGSPCKSPASQNGLKGTNTSP